MRFGRIVPFVVIASLAFIVAATNQARPVKTGAGAVAHNLCSSIFISDLPEKETYDQLATQSCLLLQTYSPFCVVF
jgi:hypothetical protein